MKSIKNKKRIKSNKTVKNKKLKNQTEDEPYKYSSCVAGLKPFEEEFLKKKHTFSRKKEMAIFRKKLSNLASPKSITPQDDFYTYINYNWLKKISLKEEQRYITQIDDFRLTQDKVYNDLKNITLDYIKSNNNKLARELKNFYNSVVSMNTVVQSKAIVKEIIEKIDEIRLDRDGVWKLLAYVNRSEIIPSGGSPFIWSVVPDDKHNTTCISYINGPQLSIIDMSVYYDDGTNKIYKTKMRNDFKNFVKKLFKTVLGSESNNFDTDEIYNIEVDIFNAYGCVEITRKTEPFYNKVSVDDALDKYDFNWKEFSKELGYKTPPKYFVTSSLNYLKCGTDLLLKNWNTDRWRTYWVWLFIKVIARMNKEWETIIFEFYGETERGQEKINKSDAVSSALYMSIPFNTFFTNEYIKKYQNDEVIGTVSLLCNELKLVFISIIEKNTWLSPSTRKYAIKKLQKLNFVIGNPRQLREDPLLGYDNNLYKNMEKIMLWRHEKFVELEGKTPIDIPMMDWTQYPVKMVGTQAYIVNASYTPSKNNIYINQGYIQSPFIDLSERGLEYNLANIGFTIAHELSHSLDDWGSQYDFEGNLYNWWTPEDKKKYKDIQKDVIKQYEEFAARDGIKFDASIGIGEDLADISGLTICNNYLWDFQEKNTDIIPIKRDSFFMFYSYFAYQQRQKVNKKALVAQLKTNPHPLDKYRCNVPLSRSTIFTALYKVKKGDGMWWHNHNTIW